MITGDAIPNTTKEVRYRIKLDPEGLMLLSFGRADGVDGRKSFQRNQEIWFLNCCGLSRRYGTR
jgi:hypothetical protein